MLLALIAAAWAGGMHAADLLGCCMKLAMLKLHGMLLSDITLAP